MAEELEQSQIENLYNEAIELKEAAKYVIRFERKVSALKSAAEKFEKTNGYKDANELAKECLDEAAKVEKAESIIVFEKAVQRQKDAKVKSDYVAAIEEYNRTISIEEYKKQSKQKIEECKKSIVKLQSNAARKRKLIALGILAGLCLILSRTKVYPMVKGVVHQKMGHYQAALNNYKMAQGVPYASTLLASCYYDIGNEKIKKGNELEAMHSYKKANTYKDAAKKTADLERKILKESQNGDLVSFGRHKWYVANKEQNRVLLVSNKASKKTVYSREESTEWKNSNICNWLNTTFVKDKFSEEEINLIQEQYTGRHIEEITKPQLVYILNQKEYLTYQENIQNINKKWWLRDTGFSAMEGNYVTTTGQVKKTYVNDTECYIRPVIVVNL